MFILLADFALLSGILGRHGESSERKEYGYSQLYLGKISEPNNPNSALKISIVDCLLTGLHGNP